MLRVCKIVERVNSDRLLCVIDAQPFAIGYAVYSIQILRDSTEAPPVQVLSICPCLHLILQVQIFLAPPDFHHVLIGI